MWVRDLAQKYFKSKNSIKLQTSKLVRMQTLTHKIKFKFLLT